MKINEIREKNKAELKILLEGKKNDLGKLRFEISSKQLKNHRQFRNVKKDIARISTVLKDKNDD
ncbi:MAG: 50S ribosomal protein L29 [Candidatus Moranbacteria bacterium RIFCSPHIGHO2_02_FULL_40_12b]|nr:MAG: 50S ribosomal protein L29 [Candidatus Moranbacteria bacterium RIFCSPHIGHO2_02_FULL_40_12b]OGI22926.1 MAG: 50S ribosomal protein L29 [Candidatus Moranbacteria bacterium RIFCSPHIGHO2_12_FULL_40_10]